eukprot:Colp12_sorted_trinity150504_noHs@538
MLLENDQHKKFVLVGHSVGTAIALEMLKVIPEENIEKAILLFPTIRHIAKTPAGMRLTPIFPVARHVVSSVAEILHKLPQPMKKKFLHYYLGFEHTGKDHHAVTAAEKLMHYNGINNSIYMAMHEMREIQEADFDNIKRNLNKLIFYYGQKDHWTLDTHYDEMKQLFPDGEIYLCPHGAKHAFVLRDSEVVAKRVAEWLQRH